MGLPDRKLLGSVMPRAFLVFSRGGGQQSHSLVYVVGSNGILREYSFPSVEYKDKVLNPRPTDREDCATDQPDILGDILFRIP